MSVPALAQVSASVLNLSAISGSSLPQSQIFGVSSTDASLPVTVNSVGLAPGVYNGTVSIAPSTGIAGGAIGGFSVSPSSLNFLYQTGTSNPAAQSAYVSNCNGIVNYAASSNVSWLRLTSVNNSIPAQTVTGTSNLTVYVDPSGLSPGFYSANITVGVTLTATGTPVAFTASANSTGWLLVGPQSGNTGGSNGLIVSVSPREPAC